MTTEELEIKRFELEQRIRIEELELKKKEFDLKIQEQKSKTIFTPLVITVVGGLITLITGIVLKYFEGKATTELEDRKFQSTLLLKATEAKNYDEFSNMLLVFQQNGLLNLDSAKILNFKKKKFEAEAIAQDTTLSTPTQRERPKNLTGTNDKYFYWTIVAGGDANLEGARFEQKKFKDRNYKEVSVWLRQGFYRTCIGKYSTYEAAVSDLFNIKETLNKGSYIVRADQWCSNSSYDSVSKMYICR